MGTTALIFIQEGSVGILFINMKCFVLSGLLSLSLAAPAPEAEAALGYPLFGHHVAPLAVVPVKQLQWPGVSVPGVDSTCFGCRASVVVPVGRRRREAEAEAEAATPFYHLPLAPFHPYHVPAVALHSSSYAAVNNAGVAYDTGLHTVHVFGRGRRDAEAEAEADPAAEAIVPFVNLGYGNHFLPISSGLPYAPHAYGVAAHPAAYGYPYLG